jgi:hypothetical protein
MFHDQIVTDNAPKDLLFPSKLKKPARSYILVRLHVCVHRMPPQSPLIGAPDVASRSLHRRYLTSLPWTGPVLKGDTFYEYF